MREDMRRFKKGDPLVDKDELLKMAQDSEAFLLEFETELRAACYEVEYTMLYRIPILCKTFVTRPGATPHGHSKRNMMFAYNNVNAN